MSKATLAALYKTHRRLGLDKTSQTTLLAAVDFVRIIAVQDQPIFTFPTALSAVVLAPSTMLSTPQEPALARQSPVVPSDERRA